MQELAILGTGDGQGTGAVPEPITLAARHFEPVFCSVPGAVFPGNRSARDVCAEAYVSAGVHAAAGGYAGLYINTVGDYGLAELRRSVEIPVTGAGEGAISAARTDNRRFAIVTIWPSAMGFIYEDLLSATNSARMCVAMHHLSDNDALETLDEPGNFLDDMRGCSLTSMRRIRAACRHALERDGADVIVLGCTCMQPVAALLEAEDIPVVEPMLAGYRHLEALVAAAGPKR